MDIRTFFNPPPLPLQEGKPKTTLELLGDDQTSIQRSKPIILGILGSSADNHWTTTTIQEEIVYPILAELGRLPDALILPSDGQTNLYLSAWAERQNLPLTPIQADWQRLGRRAGILRDSRILKDSTHLVFFLGPRSDKLEKAAIRELRKGKIVFTVDAKTYELAQLTLEDS